MREVALSAAASLWIGSAVGAAFAGPAGWWWAAWSVFGGLVALRFVKARRERTDA